MFNFHNTVATTPTDQCAKQSRIALVEIQYRLFFVAHLFLQTSLMERKITCLLIHTSKQRWNILVQYRPSQDAEKRLQTYKMVVKWEFSNKR